MTINIKNTGGRYSKNIKNRLALYIFNVSRKLDIRHFQFRQILWTYFKKTCIVIIIVAIATELFKNFNYE